MSKKKRMVSFSMCHPVYVTVEIERATDDDDWEIVGVRDVSCDASARSINDNMSEDDWNAFDRAISKPDPSPRGAR